MAQSGPKWPKMAQIAQSGPKWPKVVEMAQNGPKWPRMTQMAQSGPNGKRQIYLPEISETNFFLGRPVYGVFEHSQRIIFSWNFWTLFRVLNCRGGQVLKNIFSDPFPYILPVQSTNTVILGQGLYLRKGIWGSWIMERFNSFQYRKWQHLCVNKDRQ